MELVKNAITQGLTDLGSNISKFFNDLVENIGTWFADTLEDIREFNSSVGSWFSDLGSNIGTWFSNLGTSLSNWFADLGSNLKNLLSYINPFDENFLGKKLIELIGDLLNDLFVPKEDHFGELHDKINEKFGFISQFKDLVYNFFGLEQVDNGNVYIKTASDYEYPGFYITYEGYTFSIIDFSTFDRFRSIFHGIIISILWISYLWRLYRRSPEIVAGFKRQGA